MLQIENKQILEKSERLNLANRKPKKWGKQGEDQLDE